MLTLRKEQVAPFAKLERERFVQKAIAHVEQFFPSHASSLGRDELAELVQYGIKRAALHRITAGNEVLKYIDVAVLLGRDFDTDKRRPWAAQILGSDNLPATRVQMLIDKAKKELKGA